MDIGFLYHGAREALAGAKKVLIITHSKPDGDAIGASSAFVDYCLGQGIDAAIYCADPAPEQYSFLSGSERFTADRNVFAGDHDAYVILDCGGMNQTAVADLIAARPRRTRVISMDHHLVNDIRADINIVDNKASSASEIVYRFLRDGRAEITGDIATALLTGIYFDTIAFTNSLTGRGALEAAADLLRLGADVNLITERIFRSRPLNSLRLWGAAMARLKHDERLGVVSTAIFMEDATAMNDKDSIDGISNLLGSILDAQVVMVLKEMPGGLVRGSMRAAGDRDVSAVAKELGGGGHRKAAGFTIPGRIAETATGWRVE